MSLDGRVGGLLVGRKAGDAGEFIGESVDWLGMTVGFNDSGLLQREGRVVELLAGGKAGEAGEFIGESVDWLGVTVCVNRSMIVRIPSNIV